jgi:hypothetical protein
VIDFSAVVGPTHGNTLQEPGQQVLCPSAWLVKSTDGNGVAIFHPQFFGCVDQPLVRITGNGYCLGYVKARSTDVAPTAPAITDVADFAAFAGAYLGPGYRACFDYNDDGTVGLFDLGVFAHDYSNSLPSAYCPAGW